MKKISIILTIIIILLGSFALLRQRATKSQTNKSQIVASFYPLYYFASEIAGDKANVANITPGGIEPHDYELTAQNITLIQKSKLLIVNGAGFEPWLTKLQNDLSNNSVKIVNATEKIALQEAQKETNKQTDTKLPTKDPHVWLNPILAKKQVATILQALIAVDPQNKTTYETNAATLTKKLTLLDQQYQTGLSNCQQNHFVTSHAAFAYLANEYGLTMIAISGLSPEAEPSAQQLANVAAFAKKNYVKYIFFETLVSPKLSETIANEVGIKTLILDPIEGISDDDRKQGKNYFTIMGGNLKNLQEALQCNK
jgi:zinc transport system substrate-binding protein